MYQRQESPTVESLTVGIDIYYRWYRGPKSLSRQDVSGARELPVLCRRYRGAPACSAWQVCTATLKTVA